MSLSPEDEALLSGAREGLEPTRDDRRRIRAGVAAQLGLVATVTAASAGASSASSVVGLSSAAATTTALGAAGGAGTGAAAAALTTTTGVTVAKALGSLLFLAALGGGALYFSRDEPPASAPSAAKTVTAPSTSVEDRGVAPTPPILAEPLAAATAESSAPVVATAPAAPKHSSKVAPAEPAEGALTVETRLVSDARTAARAGDSSRALALLEQHARRFPGGVLAEERDAERAVLLCTSGRTGEGRTRAARFFRDYPKSALGANVRARCDVNPR